MKGIFLFALISINIYLVIMYNIVWALFILVAFLLSTAMSDCCKKNWISTVLGSIIMVVAIGEMNLMFLFLMVPIVIYDIFSLGMEAAKEESDYIWRMNDGPSSLSRVRMLNLSGSNKISILVWKGGADGYYECNDRKFDRYLQEIK